MNLIFRHEASEDFWLAVEHYESEEAGIGVRFRDEVQRFIGKIKNDPYQARVRRALGFEYRRVNLNSFPYYIAYIIERDRIFVVAVSHGHKMPEHWMSRLES